MRAVLLADTPTTNALLDGHTVFDRLVAQLNRFDVTDITVIARPGCEPNRNVTVITSADVASDLAFLAEYADASDEPTIVASADAILADTAASQVLSDPTRRSGALVVSGTHDGSHAPRLRLERGLVVSVGTDFHVAHGANGYGAGLAKISAPYVPDWRAALRQLLADDVTALAQRADAWTLQLLALVRGGAKLTAYQVPGLEYRRPDDDADATTLVGRIDAVDEDAVRMGLCVKRDDDLFATYSISTWSRHLVRFFERLKWTPVAVTWLSILFAVIAAGLFVEASRVALIGGAVALYLSFALDCVDGQLARYAHRFSAFGGWLDMIADRGKEYLMYAGLAAGAAANGLTWAWPLAIAAITVQVVRHMMDTWYGTMQDAATLRQAEQSLLAGSDKFAPAGGGTGETGSAAVRIGRQLGALSAKFTSQHRSPSYWFKRTIVFPVGERWLVMGLGAALFDGRVALAALLAWQLLAFAYTLAGRTLRSWAAKVPVLAREGDVSTHRDDGLIARFARAGAPPLPVAALALALIVSSLVLIVSTPGFARGAAALAGILFVAVVATARNPHSGPLDWLVPACLRAGEFGMIIACGLAADVPAPLVYALLFVLSLYHYDLAARIDKAASPLDSRAFGLGWDGRTAVVLLSLIPGLGVVVFAALTVYIGVVFLGGALLGRRIASATRKGTPTPAPAL
ncbi:DUF5941 domain-containing protein [Stackebrandtia soli]|uniref:DUF5941 domain-containing protein n=1 Tax=Stackebrandtia soli TaxID=1892856 RepID=UPI0039E94E0D